MLPEKILNWGCNGNIIRELAAYGAARRAEIGADGVFDFTMGSPSVPAPASVKKTMLELLETMDGVSLHEYTPALGLPSLRIAVADHLNRHFDAGVSWEQVYITTGASAGLSCACRGLLNPGEEAVTVAPFFPEYTVFAENAGAKLIAVQPKEDLQPDLEQFAQAISEKTRLVILNSPNNPSGVVLTEESLRAITEILNRGQEKYGHCIYLLSDEPYRELLFDGSKPLCVTKYYKNAIICYSYSKSLSLPGERIGYLAVGGEMEEKEKVFAALVGAFRAHGYINAPTMIQRVVERCIDETADISRYKVNRDLLYGGLTKLGFTCVKPDGAFYLFMKAPEEDAKAFSDKAKKYELLLVPSDDFGVPGYVRIAYCVAESTIRNSMPAFAKLAEEYGLKK